MKGNRKNFSTEPLQQLNPTVSSLIHFLLYVLTISVPFFTFWLPIYDWYSCLWTVVAISPRNIHDTVAAKNQKPFSTFSEEIGIFCKFKSTTFIRILRDSTSFRNFVSRILVVGFYKKLWLGNVGNFSWQHFLLIFTRFKILCLGQQQSSWEDVIKYVFAH